MKAILITALVALAAVILGCGKPPETKNMNQTIMRVSVFRNGQVEIDGRPFILAEAENYIATKAGTETMAYYYREAGQEDPHPNAMIIIKAIAEAKLPISLSTKPDFSDFVDQHGNSQPRK